MSGAQATVDSWWLVVADSELGAEIGRVLGDDSRVTVLPPSMLAEDADKAALADALAGVTHVLYAPQVSSGYFDAESGYGLFNAARRLTAAVAAMALPPRLFLLTRNAQPVGEGDRANPAHAVLWGLGRTLALEHPEIWGGIIDVDESVPAGLAARSMWWTRLTVAMERIRSFIGPVYAVSRACKGVTRHRPRPSSSTKTAAIWSSGRPAISDRT